MKKNNEIFKLLLIISYQKFAPSGFRTHDLRITSGSDNR